MKTVWILLLCWWPKTRLAVFQNQREESRALSTIMNVESQYSTVTYIWNNDGMRALRYNTVCTLPYLNVPHVLRTFGTEPAPSNSATTYVRTVHLSPPWIEIGRKCYRYIDASKSSSSEPLHPQLLYSMGSVGHWPSTKDVLARVLRWWCHWHFTEYFAASRSFFGVVELAYPFITLSSSCWASHTFSRLLHQLFFSKRPPIQEQQHPFCSCLHHMSSFVVSFHT